MPGSEYTIQLSLKVDIYRVIVGGVKGGGWAGDFYYIASLFLLLYG